MHPSDSSDSSSSDEGVSITENTDLELGRSAAHGVILGAVSVAHVAIDADPDLSPAQRQFRHDVATVLQFLSHSVINATAEAIAKRRGES